MDARMPIKHGWDDPLIDEDTRKLKHQDDTAEIAQILWLVRVWY